MRIHSLAERNGEMASINMIMKIDNISAHSTRDYKVYIKGENRKENSHLKLKIDNASKEPSPVVEWKIPPAPENEFYKKGNNLTKQRKYAEAIKAYKKAYEINPKSAKVINNWGIVLQYKGMVDEAIEKYEEVIRVDPSFSPPYFNIGVIYFEKKNYDFAIAKFEKAIQLNSKHIDSYFLCARAYEKIEKYDDAIALYQKIVKLWPNDPLAEKARKSIVLLETK